MKKHDEGYVLAMVMCVIAVLAVVASAMLSVALQNVKTQKAAVERMQEKYAAEGQLEIVRAALENIETQPVNATLQAEQVKTKIIDTIKANAKLIKETGDWYYKQQGEILNILEFNSPTLTIQTNSDSKSGDSVVICEIVLTGKAEANGTNQFKITINNVDFQSYEATTETVPEDSTPSEPSGEVPEI